jgi:hypothetical protein
MPDRFETDILADGSKRFVYEVRFGSGSRQSAGRSQAPSQEIMEEALEDYFAQDPYCEQGYFLYDQGFDGSSYTILGECQESAATEINN